MSVPSVRIKYLSDKVSALVGEKRLLMEQLTEKTICSTDKEVDLDLHAKARKLLELFVKSTEYSIKNYIEPTITEALEFVFSQYLKFHIVFFNRRNQVEIDFIVIRNPNTEKLYQQYLLNPVESEEKIQQIAKESRDINYMYGGAINQTISLVLRLVMMELLHVKGPVFLDEPTSMVAEEFNSKLGHLLVSLSRKFKRQYVLITHSRSLASYASKIYQVEHTGGYSHATLLEGDNNVK